MSTAKKNKKEKADDSASIGLDKGKADDSASNGLDAIPEQEISNTLKHSSPKNFRSGSIKLGDVVTAKVYQIRAYGLVLELSDGVRGMHKFVVISYPALWCSLLVNAAARSISYIVQFSEPVVVMPSFGLWY